MENEVTNESTSNSGLEESVLVKVRELRYISWGGEVYASGQTFRMAKSSALPRTLPDPISGAHGMLTIIEEN